jgi:hypothetical protein
VVHASDQRSIGRYRGEIRRLEEEENAPAEIEPFIPRKSASTL